MSESLFEQLQSIDQSILTDVVRSDQKSPDLEITGWSVRRLSDKGIINPNGLWLFNGLGRTENGEQPWSVVLKVFIKVQQETPPPPDHIWHWKREVSFAQSNLPEAMPGPLKAPRYYRIDMQPNGAWLWMEYIDHQKAKPWGLEEYLFAAYELGRWNGAGIKRNPPFNEPWFSRRIYIPWLDWINVEKDWQFPLNQTRVPSGLRHRYAQYFERRREFYTRMEELPHLFSHLDTHCRNLFIRKNSAQQDELVAVDWALCGLGPLGAELNGLVAANGMLLEWSPADLPKLEAALYPIYFQGLQDAGWTGDEQLVRLGYEAWKFVYYGLIFPGYSAWWCAPENREFALQIYGSAEESLFDRYFPMLEFSLDGADYARRLMSKNANL